MQHRQNRVYKNQDESQISSNGFDFKETMVAPRPLREINFLDIKHLNDIAEENKQTIKNLLLRYKTARLVFKNSESVVYRLYASYEMAFARRQVSDLWCIYQSARTDSHNLTIEYIRRLNMDSRGVNNTENRLAA
jgi:hypothetical protein